jgi:hypothetical protein
VMAHTRVAASPARPRIPSVGYVGQLIAHRARPDQDGCGAGDRGSNQARCRGSSTMKLAPAPHATHHGSNTPPARAMTVARPTAKASPYRRRAMPPSTRPPAESHEIHSARCSACADRATRSAGGQEGRVYLLEPTRRRLEGFNDARHYRLWMSALVHVGRNEHPETNGAARASRRRRTFLGQRKRLSSPPRLPGHEPRRPERGGLALERGPLPRGDRHASEAGKATRRNAIPG